MKIRFRCAKVLEKFRIIIIILITIIIITIIIITIII